MYLIFDTETTGFPLWNEDPFHPRQARIVQIACLLLDKNYKEVGNFYSLVRLPSNVIISEGAFSAHGISTEMCAEYGMPMEHVLSIFDKFMEKADVVAAHNLKFDSFMIDVEQSLRESAAIKYDWKFNGFCTMLESTDVCKLPKTSNRGSGTYKWPKLHEALKVLCGEELKDAHDSLADCRATAKVLRKLKTRVPVLA